MAATALRPRRRAVTMAATGGSPTDAEEIRDHIFRIRKDGYTVLRAVWSPERCRLARERLDELRTEAATPGPVVAGEAFGCSHLYNKGEIFEGVYKAPRLLALVRHFLGDDATIMSLGDHGVYGTIMPPANHQKPRRWGDEKGLHNDGSLTGA